MAQVPSNLIPTTVTQLPTAPVADENSLMMIVYQGVNYKIRVGDLLSVAGVPTSRQVIAGTGLQGGGQLTSNVTLSIAPGGVGSSQLANTGVAAGTYGSAVNIPVFTVDSTGRVTSATVVPAEISGYVPETRQVIAGTGLNGGGALNNNVTLNADLSDATPEAGFQSGAAGVSTNMSRADHKHPAVDLSDDDQVDNVLGLENGGTANSLVPDAGAIVWSGADGLYIGPVGVYGQVLTSNGANEYIWSNIATDAPQPAHYVWIGPTSGPDATPFWRALVNGDLPGTLDGKTLTNVDINSGTIDNTIIGGSTPLAGTFTTASATTVNATTANTTNLEATNLKAKDGTAAGSIANTTGVVTLNSAVLSTADINGGTIDNSAIGASTPSTGVFSQLNVDNLEINNNVVSSTNTDGNIDITPNGTGSVVISKVDINSGSVDSTTIGATTPAAGSFTNVAGERFDFDTTPPAQVDQEGRLYWNNADSAKTLNIGMANSVVQQVGEELFYRVKAQGAIANGDVVMFAGTVGASGGLIAAKATGLSANQTEYIMGVATENISNNSWGYITFFGEVKGINTTGGPEAWVDGQILYYNPAVAGGLTKNKPAVPNPIVIVAAVVHAASNGTLFVRPTYGSTLGQTDGNVSFGSLSNGDVIVYDSALQYWKNVAQSTLSVGSATTATNLAGGAAGSIPYQTGAGATSLLAAGSGVLVGGSTPSYSTSPSLTGTNFTSIPNGALTNSSVTVGTTSIALGASSLTLGGLTSVAVTQDPSSALQLATKQYVDGLVSSGITYHTPVKYEVPNTTGNLTATYNNGTAGVGATLTNSGTLIEFTPDGVIAQVNDRILVYNQTNAYENGIYTVTTVGDGSTPWVLTRATDANSYGLKTPNKLGEGDAFFVTSGNTGAGETYACNTSGTITFGTTAITFTQITSSQVYSAGTGLTLTNTQFSLTSPVVLANGGTGLTSYTAGDLPYFASGTAFSKLAIGAASRILTSSGSAPQWTDPSGITVGSATTATSATSATSATTATNLASGSAGTIPYQSAAGTTAMLAAGTADYVLKANGAAAPSWVAQSTLSVGSASTATSASSATTASNLAGGGTGALPYNSSAGTTTFLNLGTQNYVLIAGASSPEYAAQSTLSVGSASTATTATNIAGGAAGSIAYNTSSGTTSFLSLGTQNYVLIAGATAPQYAAQSTLSVGSASTATSATTATNVAGGAANKIVYNTNASTTSFIDAPVSGNTFLKWNGSAFTWDAGGTGSVTSVDVSGGTTGLTFSGGPVTTSGTITMAGTLALANGGSGQTSAQAAMNAFAGAVTTGYYLRGNGSNVVMAAIQAGDVPTLNQNTTGSAASLSISGQTGLLTFTGLTSTNRDKTVRDAADTILELGGSYTPTGTWNWTTATVTWPTFNQNTTGTAAKATNIDGGAQGSLPYQSAAATTAFLAKDTNATRYLSNTGASNNPAWAQIDLSNGVTGTLPIANGGTNATATPTAGGAAYGTGTAYAFTAAGTAGYVLTSNGAAAPTWSGISGGTF